MPNQGERGGVGGRERERERESLSVYAHAWVREERDLSKGLVRRQGLPLPRQMETDPSLLLLPPLPRADSCRFHGRMLWIEKGLEYCFPKVGGIQFTTNGSRVYLCYIIRRPFSLHSFFLTSFDRQFLSIPVLRMVGGGHTEMHTFKGRRYVQSGLWLKGHLSYKDGAAVVHFWSPISLKQLPRKEAGDLGACCTNEPDCQGRGRDGGGRCRHMDRGRAFPGGAGEANKWGVGFKWNLMKWEGLTDQSMEQKASFQCISMFIFIVKLVYIYIYNV